MVKTEKRKMERYLFSSGYSTLVPFEATVRGGKLTVTTFRKTKTQAKAFYKKYKNAPFSAEAKKYIFSELAPVCREWGYEPAELEEGHIVTLMADRVDKELIKESTLKIKSLGEYINLTEYELEPIPSESEEYYFVTVIDGKIVSVCETNAEDAFIGAKEINVYTAPEYRGKGYGASNVTAMTEYYLSLGYNVAYTCRNDNKASIALAARCGYKQIAETYYFICHKEE